MHAAARGAGQLDGEQQAMQEDAEEAEDCDTTAGSRIAV